MNKRQQWYAFCGLWALFWFVLGLVIPVFWLMTGLSLSMMLAPVGVAERVNPNYRHNPEDWKNNGHS